MLYRVYWKALTNKKILTVMFCSGEVDGITFREINDRIHEKGYSGTKDAIRGFISKERRIQRDLINAVGGDTVELIDKKWLIRLLYKPIEDVRGISPEQLEAIFDNYPIAKNILDIIYEFKKLIKANEKESLLPWMNKVVALDIPRCRFIADKLLKALCESELRINSTKSQKNRP